MSLVITVSKLAVTIGLVHKMVVTSLSAILVTVLNLNSYRSFGLIVDDFRSTNRISQVDHLQDYVINI